MRSIPRVLNLMLALVLALSLVPAAGAGRGAGRRAGRGPDGGPPKLRFAVVLLPDQVVVDTPRTLTACLVNEGEDGELRRDAAGDDWIVLRIPVGDADSDLASTDSAPDVTCADPPGGWSCEVAVAGDDALEITFRPSGESVQVAALQSTCFDLLGVRVGPTVGVAFSTVDQHVDASRAEDPVDAVVRTLKSTGGFVRHDDLAEVRDDQHDNPITLFSKVGGTATDAQIPDDVTITFAASAGDLDCAGCVDEADIAPGAVASDAIADASIVDADVSASAAIDGSKVLPDFRDQDVRSSRSFSLGTAGAPTVRLHATSAGGVVSLGTGADDRVVVESGRRLFDPLCCTDMGGSIRISNVVGTETIVLEGGGQFAGPPPFAPEGGELQLRNAAGSRTLELDGDYRDMGRIRLWNEAGENTIEILADEAGVGTVKTDVLEVRGGADLAELFDVETAARPGDVVVLDPDRPGGLRVASKPNDPLVAGVVSGAGGVRPGLTLRQVGSVADGSVPVALAGRAWVRCDADAGGPVATGDLLTTSATPGHAMRADAPAPGTVLGKAMTSLESGRGLVLVLVSLQ